jgi:hypothetical protein
MVLEFTIDRNRDPDGSQLHRLLQAQLTCECMGAARCLFTHLLAITGVAIWPDCCLQISDFLYLWCSVASFFLLYELSLKKLSGELDSSAVLRLTMESK